MKREKVNMVRCEDGSQMHSSNHCDAVSSMDSHIVPPADVQPQLNLGEGTAGDTVAQHGRGGEHIERQMEFKCVEMFVPADNDLLVNSVSSH